MNLRMLDYLVCPQSGSKLELRNPIIEDDEITEGALVTSHGAQYSIKNGIPRFVSSEEYSHPFGLEWNRHARIYFDDKDQYRIYSTQDQLERKLGLAGEKIRGKTVLDIGCGTGANGAAIAEWGAKEVFCVDLSTAVEAAYTNTKKLSNVHVIQADLFNLPFECDKFDVVYSIGVLHHTPNTKDAFAALVPFVRNGGGILAIWVYMDSSDLSERISNRFRRMTTRMNPKLLYSICWLAVPAYYIWKIPLFGKALFHFLPPISKEPYWEDRVVDTFDWYSPAFQWKHTYPEVYGWFRQMQLTDIHLLESPIAVWGKKP